MSQIRPLSARSLLTVVTMGAWSVGCASIVVDPDPDADISPSAIVEGSGGASETTEGEGEPGDGMGMTGSGGNGSVGSGGGAGTVSPTTPPGGTGGTANVVDPVEMTPMADCSSLPNVLLDDFESTHHWLSPGGGFSAGWRWFENDIQRAAEPLPRASGMGCNGTHAVEINGAADRLEVFDFGSDKPVSAAGWSGVRFAASGDGTLRFSLQLKDQTNPVQHMDIQLSSAMQTYDVPFEAGSVGQEFGVIRWERLGGTFLLVDNFGLY